MQSVISEAHPRSRGENPHRCRTHAGRRGSSPLTRGKPLMVMTMSASAGLIPAHAGKTKFPTSYLVALGAHPRSRGENSYAATIVACFAGSSPLTRGKPDALAKCGALRGLIPAHAGKTESQQHRRRRGRAHPRSRGENFMRARLVAWVRGSSPLTRGKPELCKWKRDRLRLIPAHAGKTRVYPRRSHRERAHPRSRGENVVTQAYAVRNRGSSPLTRGKHLCADAVAWDQGLIPAHAGKTCC